MVSIKQLNALLQINISQTAAPLISRWSTFNSICLNMGMLLNVMTCKYVYDSKMYVEMALI